MSTRFVWLPEHSRHPGLYATGERRGKMVVVTHAAELALQFKEQGECADWCARTGTANTVWVPRQHGFVEGEA